MNRFDETARTLGPERCQSALKAFEIPEGQHCGWNDCALAQAYGPPLLLIEHYSERLRRDPYLERFSIADFAAEVFGLSSVDVWDAAGAFDHPSSPLRQMLHDALAREAAKIHPARGLTGPVEPDPPDYPWLRSLQGRPPKDGPAE